MFTIPSLRARECTDNEKDALNLLFLAVPLLNVALPFVWKSFPFIFCADCVLMAVSTWRIGQGGGHTAAAPWRAEVFACVLAGAGVHRTRRCIYLGQLPPRAWWWPT